MSRREYVAAALAVLVTSPAAFGDTSPSTPRALYERGVAAHAAGKYAEAARHFAQADALAPHDAALGAALDSSVLADDAARAAELLERAERRALGSDAEASAREARAHFAARLARLTVRGCNPSSCRVRADGRPLPSEGDAIVLAGSVLVHIEHGPAVTSQSVTLAPGQHEILVVPPSAASGPLPSTEGDERSRPASSGVSPTWFYFGVGLTAAGAAVTTASYLDVRAQHEGFVLAGCPESTTPDCERRAAEGRGAEARSHALLAGSLVVGLTTAALGVFAVTWSTEKVSSPVRTARIILDGMGALRAEGTF